MSKKQPLRGGLFVFRNGVLLVMVYLVSELRWLGQWNHGFRSGAGNAELLQLVDFFGLMSFFIGMLMLLDRRAYARWYWIGVLLTAVPGMWIHQALPRGPPPSS
jgi:hypothetical protein